LPGASNFDYPTTRTVVTATAAQPSKSVFALGVAAIVLIGFAVFTTHRLPLVGFGTTATTSEALPAC
jgi:hypothetical protein